MERERKEGWRKQRLCQQNKTPRLTTLTLGKIVTINDVILEWQPENKKELLYIKKYYDTNAKSSI
jgi:hypothetical protein